MPKPILLAIDDDTSVLEAVVQDLRRHYGQDYRIVRAASGAAALDICRQLKERKDIVALFLSDQRMPGMTGVDFLQQAIPLYPDAKRVLLTAYADTEAAIRAINSAKIHYYLNKPWDPPEEKLYPVLDDLLETWKQGYKPPYEGIIVVGTRWSSADHNVREFLSRNRIPYKWLSPEQNPEAIDLLRERGLDDSKLPVVIFGDGTSLVQPTSDSLATKLGMPTPGPAEVLRRRYRRRRPRRPRWRCLCSLRRPQHANRRRRSHRRTGWLQLKNRKLSRLPAGPQRSRSCRSGLPSGGSPGS